jgi:hypothetical protein
VQDYSALRIWNAAAGQMLSEPLCTLICLLPHRIKRLKVSWKRPASGPI